MPDLAELAAAIEEGAAWRWWATSADYVQLEFSSPQLARETSPHAIPSPIATLALSFDEPHEFAFLTRVDAGDVPPDWPRQMAADSLDFDSLPTSLSFQLVALNDRDCLSRVLAIPHNEEWAIEPSAGVPHEAQFHLAFWAGNVGAKVAADGLQLHTHDGPIELAEVSVLRDAWWTYWRAYWRRRGSSEALPYDPSCEVTIPFK